MMHDTPTVPPLRRYLDRYGMTVAEFLRRFERASGARITHAAVSQWAHGTSAPRAQHQLVVQEITGGEVTVLDWARWSAESEKRKHRNSERRDTSPKIQAGGGA